MSVIFHKDGYSKLVNDEEEAALLKLPEWADTPAAFGVETCPGQTPDPVIAARKHVAEVIPVVAPELPIEAEPEPKPTMRQNLRDMTLEQLRELAQDRGLNLDKRWGKEKLIEALDGDRT